MFPFILHGTVIIMYLPYLFDKNLCRYFTIKILLNRIFKTNKVMKRRIFFSFCTRFDFVHLSLGYVFSNPKRWIPIFKILLIFSNFSLPFIRKYMNYLKIRSEIDMVIC